LRINDIQLWHNKEMKESRIKKPPEKVALFLLSDPVPLLAGYIKFFPVLIKYRSQLV